jgi:hypothetical protein
MVLIVTASISFHLLMGFKVVPSFVPIAVIMTGLPSGIISRCIQIRHIIKAGDSGSVSAMTWFASFLITFCRFWSNFLTIRDPILLFKVGSAMTLNLALTIVILVYKKNGKKEKGKNE